MSHHILLVEDNPDIAQLIMQDLTHADYHVTHAPSGTAGIDCAQHRFPDLIIVDLGLPDLHGFSLVRKFRANSNVPIIVLTAMDTTDLKVQLLQFGANDYITKPFSSPQLLARVHVQLRHQTRPGMTVVGKLELDMQRRTVRYDQRDAGLTHKEFDLLACLTQQPSRVFTHLELRATVWRRSSAEDVCANLVNVHNVRVANVRSKLRKCDAFGVIRTVRGVGYALSA